MDVATMSEVSLNSSVSHESVESNVSQDPSNGGFPVVDEQFRTSGGIFIIGAPRSGTSVLSWALAAHSQVGTGPEADFFYFINREGWLREAYGRAHSRQDGWLAMKNVTLKEFMACMGVGLESIMRGRYGLPRWVDSTPSNVLSAEDLMLMFPGSRFLNIVRDGRAAVASMQASGFDVRIARDFKFACETWARYVYLGHRFSEDHPDRCLELRQEALICDPEGTMEAVQQFLELAPSPAVAEFLRNNRINSSFGKANVRGTTIATATPSPCPWTSWKAKQRKIFLKQCTEMMTAMGYSLHLD